ncbi:MAG TPA: hypothetical protein VH684_16605 [Xanthobacteraceae bacterium]|jgi:hypothetical protein
MYPHRRRKYRPPYEIEDHKRAAVGHSKKRIHERTGLRFPEQAIINHGLLIEFRQSTLLGTGGGGRELHKIVVRGHSLYSVYDNEIRRIVTYLHGVSEWRGTLTKAGREALQQELPTTEKASVGPATAIAAG